jgi:hypothetical protein
MRRRVRTSSPVRTRIRIRVWLACVGALLVMLIGIYFALGHSS